MRRISAIKRTMCKNPILIDNPNRGHKPDGLFKLKDCKSQKIMVPCGHCDECVKVRQMSFVQRCQMEALENHVFFATLTYNNQSIPTLGLSDGYSVRYVDLSDVSNMFKRIRAGNLFGRPFRYVYVTELGSMRGRPHVHLLLFLPKYSEDTYLDCLALESKLFNVVLSQWKRNIATPVWSEKSQKYIPNTRSPVYRDNCTFIRYFVRGKLRTTYDLHYVNPILSDGCEADVAFYVSKYMIKQSEKLTRLQQALRLNLPDDEYKDVWNKVKPRWSASPLFGLNGKFISHNKYEPSPVVLDYIHKCILDSRLLYDSPKFINPVDGKSFPLSLYYLNRLDCMSVDDWFFFYDKSVAKGVRSPDNSDSSFYKRDRRSLLNDIDAYNLKMSRLEFDFDDFDDLF